MKKKTLITISLMAVIFFTGCNPHNKIMTNDDLNMDCIENKSLVFSGPTRNNTDIEKFRGTGCSENE